MARLARFGFVLAGLGISAMSEARKVAEPTAIAAVSLVEKQRDVVLTGFAPLHGRTIGADVGSQRDEITTVFTPQLAKGDADVYHLTGWGLSQIDNPGDLVVEYQLLLAVPAGGSGAVSALLYENHQEVPTLLWQGEGTLGPVVGRGQALSLTLTDVDGGEPLTVTGTLRLR